MTEQFLVNFTPQETRVALLQQGVVQELHIERTNGRGIVGNVKGELVIASPLYKQHFRLADGTCMEYPEQSLRVWPARLNGDAVEIGLV